MNPDFDPNEEATPVENGNEERQTPAGHESNADQSGKGNENGENSNPTPDGEHHEGETTPLPESKPKPKRYVKIS